MTQSRAAATAPEDLDRAIGERVHTLMWRRRMTQVEMATAIGATQGAVSRKLRGDRPWFPTELRAAADVLGVSVGNLFGETTTAGPDRGPNPPSEPECAGRESNPQPAD